MADGGHPDSAPDLRRGLHAELASYAIIRTVVIVLIWIWVHLATRQLLKRLHYLEEFLRVCSWCRKVSSGHEWIDMERYLNSKFATKTSHGMCPDCLRKKKDEIASGDKATTTV